MRYPKMDVISIWRIDIFPKCMIEFKTNFEDMNYEAQPIIVYPELLENLE